MGNKARQQVFDLLAQAPSDTSWALWVFLRTEVCKPTDSKLADIGDKTLARHLNGLINGANDVHRHSSPSARRASQGTSLSGKFLIWGLGDASRTGEWHAALGSVRRFMEARSTDSDSWRVGQAVAYLGDMLDTVKPSNREVTALVAWLLDGELEFALKNHLHYKVKRSCRLDSYFEDNWERRPWGGLGVGEEALYLLALPLCEGSATKARQLVAALL